MIYFTSDTHFYHKAIIKYCNRPWVDVDEMNEGLIERWNSKVKPLDVVYHLGDFAFTGIVKAQEIFNRLNGFKVLIKGNHDNYKMHAKLGWQGIHDYLEQHADVLYEDDEGNICKYAVPIVMMHFPILSWNGMANGSWHLHGHCHGSLVGFGGMRLDVGVDCHNWYPLSVEDVQNQMAMKSVQVVDHHGRNNG